ncbi:MAG: hypothetical protein LUD71_07605 [Clostridiales bacterium]|nr:hypothetical protein [Clostridiales bacterium]
MKAKLWMEKNLINCTFIVAIVFVVILIWQWSAFVWPQRFALLLYAFFALHKLEEMKLGFKEAHDDLLGEHKVGLGQLCLFVQSIYQCLIVVFLPNQTWLLFAYVILAIVECPAHMLTLRAQSLKKRYFPGMITAFSVLPITGICIVVYICTNGLMLHWWWWLLSVGHFLFCWLFSQFLAVRSMGIKYSTFWKKVIANFRSKKNTNAEQTGA